MKALLQGSGWSPVTVVHTDDRSPSFHGDAIQRQSHGDHSSTMYHGFDGVVSAEIPTGQLAHAALVWYGTLAATLFAALGVVITS